MPFQLNSLMIARCTGNAGGVDVPDVLIDVGASCNVMGQQTWELLKQKGIKCESPKSAKELFAYGGIEPLLTLGTFTADVMQAGFKNGSQADFGVVEGNGHTLLGHETARVLNLLCVGPFQANCDDDWTVILERNTSTYLVVLVF